MKPPEDTVPTHLSTGENAADEIEEPFFFEETASEVDAAPEHAVEPAVAQTLDDTASVPPKTRWWRRASRQGRRDMNLTRLLESPSQKPDTENR